MSRGKKIVIIVAIVLGVIIVVGGVIGGLYVWRFTKAANDIVIKEVDIATVDAGIYKGSFKVFHVQAEVTVTVKDGEITEIDIVKGTSNPEAMETISEKVIEEQALTVDTVSGATVSQQTALKAIENALRQSSQE